MKLYAQATPYSSRVGGGLTLVDDKGRERFLIMLVGTTEGITKEENDALSTGLFDAINLIAEGIEVPERDAPSPQEGE